MFCICTLSYPHSLPRQFPLAKLPSSFSLIFSVYFFFVCFLLSSTIIRCFEKQNKPRPHKLFFLFLFWCTSVGFQICKSSFSMFCHISFLKYPRFTSLLDAMYYLCYFYIPVLFNTLPTSVFAYLIFSNKQLFASIAIRVN